MKILVTGGAGFIGSHIVDACVSVGHEVAVLDDLSAGQRRWIHPSARFYEMDIRDSRLSHVFEQEHPEIVCHQAAKVNVRESMEKPLFYADVNVLGSLNLLECCRKYGVRKLVYASTGGAAYGEPVQLPVAEDHPINPVDPYGASKHHVEHYLYLYRVNFGINYTVLRYSNVYGPRQDPRGEAGVVAIFASQMLRGQQATINGNGDQQRDFVHVSDVVRANLSAFERGDGGIYNIGTGVPTSVNQVFDLLAALTGCHDKRVHGPAKAGEVSKIFLDTARAAKELGWHPAVGLAEGIRSTVGELAQELSTAWVAS